MMVIGSGRGRRNMSKEAEEKGSRRSSSSTTTTTSSSDEVEEEFEVEDIHDGGLNSPKGSRFTLLANQVGLDGSRRNFRRRSILDGLKNISSGGLAVIHPDNRLYRAWEKFILVWAVYSSFLTPMEFGFFRGLPKNLIFLEISGQLAFLVDIFLQFFVAYRDSQTYKMVYRRNPIALRYLRSHFFIDLLGCLPWDLIYKACGRKEEVRYLLLIRLSRVRKVLTFLEHMEKDIRINYLFSRIVKLIAVELYCTHTAACIFYYLATTLPAAQEGYTWIGSLKLGDYSYANFREIDLWKRYTTSLYFAIVTMATVGYGDIHAVNLREMIFIMFYVSFDMILGAYLIGNMTALIVKGSKTERYRDKMTDLIKYMNRNRLGRDIRNQIKGHLRLQYESSYTDSAVLQDIPISIRAKISQTLYKSYIEKVPLFKGCSAEFINQIVIRVHEEFFLPGEVIMEQGNVVDQLYFVCHGQLEEVGICEDGSEETVSTLKPSSLFGEVSILCNIPQPYTVRVCELCRLLRLDKQSFSNILEIYFHDGRKILDNLLQGKDSDLRMKQLETEITLHIEKQESELALRVNSSAYHGDLYQLKSLMRAGADPNKRDYDGRTPLHLAASRGYEDVTLFLIQEGVDKSLSDNFGNTPLQEAIKNGHDKVASLLVREGASLKIDDAGNFLCSVVAKGDSDFLRRLLSNGIDPNCRDYDQRTPLHVASSQGLFLIAKLLLEAGARVFTKDRWGNTPLDEGRMCGNKILTKLLEDAKSTQLSDLNHDCSQEITDKMHPRKCAVYPFHPWELPEKTSSAIVGVVVWISHTIEELIKVAAEELNLQRRPPPHEDDDDDSASSRRCLVLLTEDAGKITDVEMIVDGQKLYLIYQ